MKKSLTLSTMVLCNWLVAQQSDGNAPTIFNGIGTFYQVSKELNIVNSALVNSSGIQLSANRRIDGTVFLNPDWQLGFICLKNGAVIDSIPMKWNALSHELFILDGEKEYIINNHFREFGYTETIDGKRAKHEFKTGFPSIEKNTEKTVYEVLGGFDFQLLKRTSKQLQENRSLDGQTYYRIAEEIGYFVYDSTNKTITVLRPGSLQQDFPQIRMQIDEYCRNNKQKCKTEEGLIRLFSGIKLRGAANDKAF